MRAHSGSPWTHIVWLHSNNQIAETHSWTGCWWLGGPKEEKLEGSHELSLSQNPVKSHVPPSPLLNDRVRGFPGGSEGLESACNGRDLGLIRGSGKSPGAREGLPTPVFLPREFHGQRSLVSYSPWGHKESDTAEWLTLSLFTFNNRSSPRSTPPRDSYSTRSWSPFSMKPSLPKEFWLWVIVVSSHPCRVGLFK